MEKQSDALPAAGRDRLGMTVAVLALAAVALHGTQASVDLLRGTKGASLNLCPADILLWAALALWGVRRIVRRDFAWPPILLPLLGVLWLILSLVPALKGAAREEIATSSVGFVKVFQFVEYFIAGLIVFGECFQHLTWRRWAIRLLMLAAGASVVVAGVQYFQNAPVTQVRGTWFADRNTFGVFLALALPLILGVSLFAFSRWAQAGAILLALAGLCTILAGGPWLALAAGLLVVAFLKSARTFLAGAVLLLLLGLLVLPHLPRRNSDVLCDSVLLYKQNDPYQLFRDDISIIDQRLAERRAVLAGKIRDRQPADYGDVPSEEDTSWKWQQRYKEWQAALSMMRLSPIFGVGAGSYQKNVNQFYTPIPKYPRNLLEPDTLSGYMVWGATAGVPFLLILLAMGFQAVSSAGRTLFRGNDAYERGLAAGIVGSLTALAIIGVFSDPLVRGTGITAALILALAQTLKDFHSEQPT